MSLEIIPIVLGPIENNTYLIADGESGEAALIDPSFDAAQVVDTARERGWKLTRIWLTHAHFDHFAGARDVADRFAPPLPIGLHGGDLVLWRNGGNAANFGLSIRTGAEPEVNFYHGQTLHLGAQTLEVRHTPGHTPGHVIFYCADAGVAFVGDLIFYRGVGRTDLPGGSTSALLHSIRTQVFTLPPATRLLSGHGPQTTVEEEKRENPFL